MSETATFALLCFTSMFTLVNPLGIMPLFMAMTGDLSTEDRNKTAKKSIIIALFVLLGFALTGQLLFIFFGISVNSLRIVGGIIFFIIGMDMLQARIGQVKIKPEEVKSYVKDISITPLAIPVICGPGAIANSIILMEDANTFSKKIVFMLSTLLILGITYVVLYSSSRLMKLIGQTGINVMMRIMGLIIMVIAVEFFFSGLKPIITDFIKTVR